MQGCQPPFTFKRFYSHHYSCCIPVCCEPISLSDCRGERTSLSFVEPYLRSVVCATVARRAPRPSGKGRLCALTLELACCRVNMDPLGLSRICVYIISPIIIIIFVVPYLKDEGENWHRALQDQQNCSLYKTLRMMYKSLSLTHTH